MASVVKKCEHTPAQRRSCKCNWIVRYRDSNGKQREQSYTWNQKTTANSFALKVEADKDRGEFVDPRQANVKFSVAAAEWVKRGRRTASTIQGYNVLLTHHINPYIGNMTLKAVASIQGRQAVETLLTVTLKGGKHKMGANRLHQTYMVIKAVVNDAVKRGVLSRSHLAGIEIAPLERKAEIIFPEYKQLVLLTDSLSQPEYKLAIWLMRGCGLRIGEALAVKFSDFNFETGTLRVSEQLGARTLTYVPLKHREKDEYRDVPVPSYVLDMVERQPQQAGGRLFAPMWQSSFERMFKTARTDAGIGDAFTPHTLRHIFASVSLSHGVPITDVSKWLGHRDINTTYAIYGHLAPSSFARARSVLDDEFSEWKSAA